MLPDTAIVDAARTPPASRVQLIKICGFAGRYARRYEKEWLAAVQAGRIQRDSDLPDATGAPVLTGRPGPPLGRARPGRRRPVGGGARGDRGQCRNERPPGGEPAVAGRSAQARLGPAGSG